jgi:hypothetical protein
MKIVLRHKWVPVENAPGVRYLFPIGTSSYLRENWAGPAVYRWVIFEQTSDDVQQLYVGEAAQLPRRINGYLNPGPSQTTNQRLKAIFGEVVREGHEVGLDVLGFDPFDVEGVPISMRDLADKTVRRFLEGLFIVYYSRSGHQLLNA